jgi:hypothetical protein
MAGTLGRSVACTQEPDPQGADMDAADMDEARVKMTGKPTTASVADGARSTDQAP